MHSHTQIHAYFFAGNLNVKADNAFIRHRSRPRLRRSNSPSSRSVPERRLRESQATLDHRTLRFVVGTNGKFTAFDTPWKLSAYFESGLSMETRRSRTN